MRFSTIAMLLGAVNSQELFLQKDHRELYEDSSATAGAVATTPAAAVIDFDEETKAKIAAKK